MNLNKDFLIGKAFHSSFGKRPGHTPAVPHRSAVPRKP
jgi:hypothetical protein